MELDVLTHAHNVLGGHLQGIDKQKEIDLYYELLSSGHSVGEILHSLDNLQCKSAQSNVTTAAHPSSSIDIATPRVTSQAALMGVTPENVERSPGLTAPIEVGSGRPNDTRHNELGSDDQLRFAGESFLGPETYIDRSIAVPSSADSALPTPPGNQRL